MSVMNIPRQYNYHVRIATILLVSAGFMLISLYVKTWMEHECFPRPVSRGCAERVGRRKVGRAALHLGSRARHCLLPHATRRIFRGRHGRFDPAGDLRDFRGIRRLAEWRA